MPDIVFPEDDCLWEVYVSYIISVMDFYCIIMGDDYAVSSIPAQCLKKIALKAQVVFQIATNYQSCRSLISGLMFILICCYVYSYLLTV